MPSTLFLQSDIKDPYKLYEAMRLKNPIYWDEANRIWAIYSYESCKFILNNSNAHIPSLNDTCSPGSNEYVLKITAQLARLSNGIQHEIAKQTTMLLFGNRKEMEINDLIQQLLKKENSKGKFDWVHSICKKLPVMAVLKSFNFNPQDCEFISDNIEQLKEIMLPGKTNEQLATINEIAKEVYMITEKHLSETAICKSIYNTLYEKYKAGKDETISLCVSNLIGLFIQSYDACRGLLSNSLLQLLRNDCLLSGDFPNKEYLHKSIIETLRFDPPVQNTRRIAAVDISLNNCRIKKADNILIVIAAANHDPHKFNNPNKYDINRTNNSDHLTFGTGGHMCLAKYFSVNLATEVLTHLFMKYKKVQLAERNILYEPLINARIPKNIFITLS